MAEVAGGCISVIARQMDTIRDEFIAGLFAMMKDEIRGLNHDARMLDLWRASLTENYLAAIHYLDRDTPSSVLEAPAAALAYARASAQRDVPLAPLVRAHRLGHARFLEVAMQYVSLLEPAQQVPTITELVNRSSRVIDMVADQLIIAYEEEHDRWLSRRSGLQQQWVGQVLAGTPVDAQRAERVLGYRLDGAHLAALAWADTTVPVGDVVSLFDRIRLLVADELDQVTGSLMVPTDEHEVRLWFSVAAPREGVPTDPSRLCAAFETAGLPARLACGRVGHGLHGFRASLNEAELVKAVAHAGGARGARVVCYTEVAPVALMAADLDELRRFVADVLGQLSIADERTEWLRETLREFLIRNRSYVATAEAMTLHRNTIQYRVAQAMELCDQSLDDPDAVFKVQTALEVCRWMAPAVLRTPT
ncbi:PucR family transcriptional regulator [Mycobacterium basiliense]|uniref:PucR family transcriptional regulator n=1 Tax=Mycobacterium basiliense TaxID=2094119 RepID=UPI00130132B1|nr:PucR family transcriptional regulator [Mycobacterium basiliense]